jgi:hypothetical protein
MATYEGSTTPLLLALRECHEQMPVEQAALGAACARGPVALADLRRGTTCKAPGTIEVTRDGLNLCCSPGAPAKA